MHWIGFDVGKAFHWVCVLDDEGEVVLSRKVEATEGRIEEALSEVSGLGDPADRVVGVDILGGPATMLEAILLERGERVRYVSGTAVNKLREAYAGGENKSDPRDAFVIADQLRMRWRSLPEIAARREHLAELKVLVGYRRDLVQEQVRRTTRLRAMLAEVFPSLESALDWRKEGPLLAVTKVATPTAARRLGEARLARWLKARGALKASTLAERVVSAAKSQKREMPAAEVKAALVAELASEILRTKERLRELDGRLEELVEADPGGKVVRNLPGMELVLTAEFLAEAGEIPRFVSADRLAAAAGIVPVSRSSGSVSYQRRERRGNRVLKAHLLPLGFLGDLLPRAQPAVLPKETLRGQDRPAGRDLPRPSQGQRLVGDAQGRQRLRGQVSAGGLKKASGCTGPSKTCRRRSRSLLRRRVFVFPQDAVAASPRTPIRGRRCRRRRSGARFRVRSAARPVSGRPFVPAGT